MKRLHSIDEDWLLCFFTLSSLTQKRTPSVLSEESFLIHVLMKISKSSTLNYQYIKSQLYIVLELPLSCAKQTQLPRPNKDFLTDLYRLQ